MEGRVLSNAVRPFLQIKYRRGLWGDAQWSSTWAPPLVPLLFQQHESCGSLSCSLKHSVTSRQQDGRVHSGHENGWEKLHPLPMRARVTDASGISCKGGRLVSPELSHSWGCRARCPAPPPSWHGGRREEEHGKVGNQRSECRKQAL